MKRIIGGFIFALATFFAGFTVSIFWISDRPIPVIEIPGEKRCQFPGDFPGYEDNRGSLGQKQSLITGVPANFWEVPLESLPVCISEIYRFVLIPDSQTPLAIRIWRAGDERWVVAKKLHDAHSPVYISTDSATEDEWRKFKSLLDRASFWEMPKFNEDKPVLNGETKWIMEALKGDKYHNVQILNPRNEFREACRYLLKLSKSRLENEYSDY
jgi:hypothetical protein